MMPTISIRTYITQAVTQKVRCRVHKTRVRYFQATRRSLKNLIPTPMASVIALLPPSESTKRPNDVSHFRWQRQHFPLQLQMLQYIHYADLIHP